MGWMEHLLMPVVAAGVARNFLSSMQDADHGIRGNQSEGAAERLGRDGVIVEIKADVGGFLRTNGKNQIGVEGV